MSKYCLSCLLVETKNKFCHHCAKKLFNNSNYTDYHFQQSEIENITN